MGLLEELEPRLLLSAAHVMTPDFKLFRPLGGFGLPADTAAPTGLTPSTIRQAYGINRVSFGSISGDGTGQTIAIVDAYNDPTIASDLQKFDLAFGLPNPVLTVEGQTGSTTSLPANSGSTGWATEIALDVEWAHVVAPGAKILLVEANSASDTDLLAAVDTARSAPGVSVVSMSWGGSEFSGVSGYDSHFTTPSGHTGVTFTASTGDSGAPDVEYPAVSPNVIAVGGTYLTANSSGNYVSESAWGSGSSSFYYGGGGGGVSRYVNQPSYQTGIVPSSNTTTRRAVPDVAMDADPNSGVPVYDSYDFGTSAPWAQVGGTSLAAPLWAGVIALANQGRALAGTSTLNSTASTQTLPMLYTLRNDFHDITTGNNGYAATAGYDLATGLGTPIVNQLVADLVGSTIPITPMPVIGSFAVNPASVTTGSGTKVTLTAGNVVESSGSATIKNVAFYLETNGTSGLQTATDKSLGNGAHSGTTWTLSSVSTTGLSAGTYTFYAVATDSANVTSIVASTTLSIVAPAPAAPANDNFANADTLVLAGGPLIVTTSNVGATREAGEPSIARNLGGKSVWYNWTAATSGTVSLNTHGSNFDTLLGVYTGNSVSSLMQVASNDDDPAGGTLTSAVTFNAVAGTTYHIAVDGYNRTRSAAGAASGNIVLNLSQAIPPVNDNFANAVNLGAAPATWTGTNVDATWEPGEPYHAGNAGGASVWFTFTATTNGLVHLNTHGSDFDTMLAVYTGNSVSTLTWVASNDDDPAGGTLTSAVTFSAVAGVTYRIAVDGYNSGWGPATGNIVLNLA